MPIKSPIPADINSFGALSNISGSPITAIGTFASSVRLNPSSINAATVEQNPSIEGAVATII